MVVVMVEGGGTVEKKFPQGWGGGGFMGHGNISDILDL